MTSTRQEDPRANQKARTRAAIVEAATRLERRGPTPTIAEAAALARVSRATAYRYFPTQEALAVELDDIGPACTPVEALVGGFTCSSRSTTCPTSSDDVSEPPSRSRSGSTRSSS